MAALSVLGLVVTTGGLVVTAIRVLRTEQSGERHSPHWGTRQDLIALALFALAVIALTYPLAFRLNQNVFTSGGDLEAEFWRTWWIGEVVTRGRSLTYTELLFYPDGVDLTFQARRWTALGVWLPLAAIMGDYAGFAVAMMLGLWVSAVTAFFLVHKLTENRLAAWIGGAFFAFYPQHVHRLLRQADAGSIQWIPLFLLALVIGLDRLRSSHEPRQKLNLERALPFLWASCALALNAYLSVKVFVQAALIGALYTGLTALWRGLWRSRAFWEAIGLFAVVGAFLVVPIVLPFVVAGPDALDGAIEQKPLGAGVDLLAFAKYAPDLAPFAPSWVGLLQGQEPGNWIGGPFYVGLITIVLGMIALPDLLLRDQQRLVWVVIGAIFWGLSLGVVLHINGQPHEQIWTPYQLFQENRLFQAIRQPFRLALGFSLPWAVLAGYGAAHFQRLADKIGGRGRVITVIVGVVLLFELTTVPVFTRSHRVSPFYFETLPDAEPGAIIDLPIGRQAVKSNMFLQRIHQRPIVEGVVTRLPEGAYDYINANPVLHAWSESDAPTCDYDFADAMSRLEQDGFRFVIVHYGQEKWMVDYFDGVQQYYADDRIEVYEVAVLKASPPC